MKTLRLILFCLLCFLVGVFLYPSLEYSFFVPDTESEKDVNQTISGEDFVSSSLTDPKLVDPIASKDIIVNWLKTTIDKDHHKNPDQTYNITKKNILAQYNSGKRDRKTITEYLYLASLENNKKAYQDAQREWCEKNPEECEESKMSVTIRWHVLDEAGIPVSQARLFILWEENIAKTDTDNTGFFSLTFESLHPRRIRMIIQHPEFSGWSYTFVTQDTRLALDPHEQVFEKDFTIIRALQKVTLDTNQKKILTWEAQLVKEWYLIENNFSKYLIPFDSIRKPTDGSIYKWKVFVSVFEFNRDTANSFLHSDVFDSVYAFASEGLRTYSMPLIFFYDEKGSRLEVFKKNPMIVWTTNRELQALILENSQWKHKPGFNPAEYDELASPENVAKYIKEDELKAYEESKKNPDSYPITMDWIYKNDSRLAGFFVYDQTTGIWEAVGYSLVAPSTDVKHSLKSLFWTKI